jgi:mRNA-degrading endonuclease RelE of RelBE toxin-antitoxin system
VWIIEFTPSAKIDVRSIPKGLRQSLRKRLEEVVAVNPENCSEELTGPLAEFRSHHFEEYRIIYKILPTHHKVVVVGVGEKNADHHAEIFKNLEGLANAGKLAESILASMRVISN